MYKLEYYQNGENPKWVEVKDFGPFSDAQAIEDFRAYAKANPSKIIRLTITA